ncbi:MAG: transporter substrate-binding domain-containing protein, partial [Gemmobacter sp.]|nr:transporter substrate-binding domain-containing protein [Gemmobacter sp.]
MKASGIRILRNAAMIGAAMAPFFALPTSAVAEPLRVAADVGYAPWAMRSASGETSGFSVDMAEAIAKRLGRDGVEVIDVNFSAIFAGLFAERYDMIVAPMQVTEARAEELLFTEGYLTSGLALVAATGNDSISGPEDLKGKILATNNGSQTDIWATENEAKYGYTIQRYDKDTDAMQAVVVGRADADIVNL